MVFTEVGRLERDSLDQWSDHVYYNTLLSETLGIVGGRLELFFSIVVLQCSRDCKWGFAAQTL